jgi:hypothetical protein
MTTVYNGENGNANSKCMVYGRERQYITATFKYKNSYVGLLELENVAATSTWVISSRKPIDDILLQKILYEYVDENMSIDDIRKKYIGSSGIKFKTQNHERAKDLEEVNIAKWTVRVLEKVTTI